MKNSLPLCLLLIGLVACNPNEKKAPLLPPIKSDASLSLSSGTLKASTKRVVELQQDFLNIEDFKNNINSYYINFETLSGHFSDMEVKCFKSGYEPQKLATSGRFNEKGMDLTLKVMLDSTDPSKVELKCLVLNNNEKIESVSLKLKKSYIIRGEESFANSVVGTDIETLLIEKGGSLSFESSDVTLKVKELVSLNGTINTFPSYRVNTTSINNPGLSGGTLNLEVNKGIGLIKFELRGLNGGEQKRIPPQNPNIPKTPAYSNGSCSINPSNEALCYGKKGPIGNPGLKGYQGLRGGDTGSLNFKVTERNDLIVYVDYFPGTGSAGGIGGPGSNGGEGGKGSLVTYREHQMTPYKRQFDDGPIGENGPPGEDGLVGTQGKNLPSIINYESGNDIIIQDNWSSRGNF